MPVKLGQNFLVDRSFIPIITEAGEISPEDTIIEIGPGKGILTEALCKTKAKIIAIEKDATLIPCLKSLENIYSNLHIINADFNTYNWRAEVGDQPYKIIANIPYNVTGLIFRTIFDYKQTLPSMVVLMIQWEVAKKIVARPDDQTVLSNLVHYFGQPAIICKVGKKAFKPAPRVDSAILSVKNITNPAVDNFADLFGFIKIGFSSRRKTLVNNLSSGLKKPKQIFIDSMNDLGIASDRRAQTLSLDEWKKLYYKIEQTK